MRIVIKHDCRLYRELPAGGTQTDNYRKNQVIKNVEILGDNPRGVLKIRFPDGSVMPGVSIGSFEIYSSDE